MELKFSAKDPYALPLQFKSHLYGIEIGCLLNRRVPLASLNRTFMELKSAAVAVVRVLRWFKSHLYGIEIHNVTLCAKGI